MADFIPDRATGGRALLYSFIVDAYLGTLDKERDVEHLRPSPHSVEEMTADWPPSAGTSSAGAAPRTSFSHASAGLAAIILT